MNEYSVFVRLQFRAMTSPYIIRVSPRDLAYLDLKTDRRILPDGTTVYFMSDERPTNDDHRPTTNDQRRECLDLCCSI